MLAGLVTGLRTLQLVEMPDPVADPGKAVIDIRYCGICGTDVHAFQSGSPYNPAICGHEWVGHVSALGSGVRDLAEGDRVAIGVASACGACSACRRGAADHCETVFAAAIGRGPLAAPHGGFASRIAFEAARLYRVDPTLSDIEAAILEPVTVAVHAVRRTALRLGERVLVIGAGPIGLLVAQAARAAGAGIVAVMEPEPVRRALARELGADPVLDPFDPATRDGLAVAIGREGADVVFECAGLPATIQAAASQVRRGGVLSLVGVPARAAEIDAAGWLAKEIRLTASIAYLHEEFAIAQGLVADARIRCAPLHTATTNLTGLEDAFARLAEHPVDVKVLVDPRA